MTTRQALLCQAGGMAIACDSRVDSSIDEAGLLSVLARTAPVGERTLVAVPVSGSSPQTGDLLIGVETAEGLPASIVLVRRESYAGWCTIFRGYSLHAAYQDACRHAPDRPRLPMDTLATQLARAIVA